MQLSQSNLLSIWWAVRNPEIVSTANSGTPFSRQTSDFPDKSSQSSSSIGQPQSSPLSSVVVSTSAGAPPTARPSSASSLLRSIVAQLPLAQPAATVPTVKFPRQTVHSMAVWSDFKVPASMEELIPVVNRLQDVFNTTGQESMDLPQIVVVGAQSSGKSSVLENIVQRDFLPRGKDIVTRRPLILQLIQRSPSRSADEGDTEAGGRDAGIAPGIEYAEFLHLPDQRFTDFGLIRQEIERETARVCGSQQSISKLPIHLRIYSSKVLTLTLVDLPGLTKIPVGDQPPDIEMRIRKLVMEYIAKPNAIILAVSPANQDLANSDSLKLAREVDPEGKRTVGVLTKLDLMDAGTNAYDILTGKSFPLRLGFVGVINRSQQDIINQKTISEALKAEEHFFRNHPAYRSIVSRCGTPFLAKTLNSILMHHIRERLPELKSKLNLLIVQTEQELSSYGDPIFSGKAHQGSLVLRLLTRFANNFNSSIDGTFAEISTSELSGGARLYYIFNNIFAQTLHAIDPCGGLSMQDIRTAIRNSTGPRPSLFIPEIAFDLLIKPQIRRLEIPCLRCVELVFDEMLKIVNSCESKELLRFPKLQHRVVEVVVEMLRERMAPTQAYIESLIAIQIAYINTNHPDFIGGGAAISMLERKHEKRRRDIERMRRMNMGPGSGMNSGLSASKPSDTGSVVEGRRESFHALPSQPYSVQTGRDGGFLTYFFGNHPSNSMSPEPGSLSRAPSPTRAGMSNGGTETDAGPADIQSSKSDDITNPMQSISLQPNQLVIQPPPEREEIEVELIRSLITSYFQITRKTITDLVPKTIMHLIVNFAKDNIQNRLVSTLYREEYFNDLLQEDEQVMLERQKCKTLLETYRQGATVLQDIF